MPDSLKVDLSPPHEDRDGMGLDSSSCYLLPLNISSTKEFGILTHR